MQARTSTQNPLTLPGDTPLTQALRWFLLPIAVGIVFSLLLLATTVVIYQARHDGRIYTGVQVWDVDLSGLTREQAQAALTRMFPAGTETSVYLTEPATGEEWTASPAELGIVYDAERTVAAAYGVGRAGGPLQALREQFISWYYGRMLAPVIVLDEGRMDAALTRIAAEVNRPAVDATLDFDGKQLDYTPGQFGRRVDVADVKARLSAAMVDFRETHLELLVHDVRPQVLDSPEMARRIELIAGSPMTLYFQEPLVDVDLHSVEISREQLAQWLRVEMVEGEGGAHYNVFLDENAVRDWLSQIESQVFRPPENARFYFDDNTKQLVLVEPHVNGRSLDVEATLARFMEQVGTPNRSLPFMVKEIKPRVHSEVTAEELGIRELVAESTTWFYDSSPERKHNIARAAAQFFGIVVAPGEEFSFNRYLGDVTEEAGFTTGLIILDGQTVEGVGGGVCQVSTTMYQTAFWAGFPITARQEHGYRVGYYDDGEGPGMDATVFSPLVDLKFVNNTEHYLLIENYYDEKWQSLTFKFYSTDVGRVVEKEGPYFENVIPPGPDVWEYNEDLAPGEIKKIDWEAEGADVTVIRRVYDENGNLLYGEEAIRSHYIPWHNSYQYGPGVDPNNVAPEDIPEK